METVPAASHAGSDRLSDLPDFLLHSVLSSLRSRQVVQTSLLSRRWRHLWRSVPCLDVDQRDFLLVEPEPEAPGDGASAADLDVYIKALKERLVREVKRQRIFEDFADAVLLLHGVCPLDAYRLQVVDWGLRADLYRWIRRGLARLPAELLVTFRCSRSDYDVPSFCFDFASGGAGALPVTSRLRRLHLYGLTLAGRFAEELRSECPVLEDLELVNCDMFGVGGIASHSLKRLHIEGRSRSYSSLGSLDSLDLPALVSLNLDKVSLPDIEDELHLQSLAVASVTEQSNEYAGQSTFLKSLSNARVLELRSFTTTGLLDREPEEFREFHNLRTLILIECEIGDSCEVVRYVLKNVPNLETLVLQDCEISGPCSAESASACRGTAFHGCKNLKSIQVKYEDRDVPRVLVAVLTQIAKDVAKTHGDKRNSVGWLDWMSRVVSCSHINSISQSVVAEPDNSLSDEEHECRVQKRCARKKHARDGAIKARRRAARLARG